MVSKTFLKSINLKPLIKPALSILIDHLLVASSKAVMIDDLKADWQ